VIVSLFLLLLLTVFYLRLPYLLPEPNETVSEMAMKLSKDQPLLIIGSHRSPLISVGELDDNDNNNNNYYYIIIKQFPSIECILVTKTMLYTY
jgi:hypothetical protein